jgi:hypothetical protein
LNGTTQLGAKLLGDKVSINGITNDLRSNEDYEFGTRRRLVLMREQIADFWNLI